MNIDDMIEQAKRHNDINNVTRENKNNAIIENKDNAIIENKEMVNHPSHYNGDSEYECIKVLKAWMTEEEYKGFLKGNTLKYLCRVGKKDAELQELKKAKWYLEKLIETFNAEEE